MPDYDCPLPPPDASTDEVDALAVEVARAHAAGDCSQDEARRHLLVLAITGPVLASCVRQQASRPTPQAREEIRDKMVDLLEAKITDTSSQKCLNLDLIADGGSLSAYTRALLSGAGRFLRQRIQRSYARDHALMSRLQEAALARGPEVAAAPEDIVLPVLAAQGTPPRTPVDTGAGSDLHQALLSDGTRIAARAAAFRAASSSYRGSRRTAMQTALLTEVLEIDPPPRPQFSAWPMRSAVIDWCANPENGQRLRALLTRMRMGEQEGDATEVAVTSLFAGYTISELAALCSQPGYVLLHLASSVCAPVPVPSCEVKEQMFARVGAMIGGRPSLSRRLVHRWVAAHSELTGSEYTFRGRAPQVKTLATHRVDVDLFEAEVHALLQGGNTHLGPSVAAVAATLESVHEQIGEDLMADQVSTMLTDALAAAGEREVLNLYPPEPPTPVSPAQ